MSELYKLNDTPILTLISIPNRRIDNIGTKYLNWVKRIIDSLAVRTFQGNVDGWISTEFFIGLEESFIKLGKRLKM